MFAFYTYFFLICLQNSSIVITFVSGIVIETSSNDQQKRTHEDYTGKKQLAVQRPTNMESSSLMISDQFNGNFYYDSNYDAQYSENGVFQPRRRKREFFTSLIVSVLVSVSINIVGNEITATTWWENFKTCIKENWKFLSPDRNPNACKDLDRPRRTLTAEFLQKIVKVLIDYIYRLPDGNARMDKALSKIQVEFNKVQLSGYKHATLEQFLEAYGIKFSPELEHSSKLPRALVEFRNEITRIAFKNMTPKAAARIKVVFEKYKEGKAAEQNKPKNVLSIFTTRDQAPKDKKDEITIIELLEQVGLGEVVPEMIKNSLTTMTNTQKHDKIEKIHSIRHSEPTKKWQKFAKLALANEDDKNGPKNVHHHKNLPDIHEFHQDHVLSKSNDRIDHPSGQHHHKPYNHLPGANIHIPQSHFQPNHPRRRKRFAAGVFAVTWIIPNAISLLIGVLTNDFSDSTSLIKSARNCWTALMKWDRSLCNRSYSHKRKQNELALFLQQIIRILLETLRVRKMEELETELEGEEMFIETTENEHKEFKGAMEEISKMFGGIQHAGQDQDDIGWLKDILVRLKILPEKSDKPPPEEVLRLMDNAWYGQSVTATSDIDNSKKQK